MPFGCWNQGSGISTTISQRTGQRCCVSIWQSRSVPRIASAWSVEATRQAQGEVSRQWGRGHLPVPGLDLHLLPLSWAVDPRIPRTAFKRWAGGRQRCRPFKDGGQLISAGGGKPRLCIARHMWTPHSSSLSSMRVESGWVLAYVRPRSAAGWPRALMISADHGPYQNIALFSAASRTGFPDPRQNR